MPGLIEFLKVAFLGIVEGITEWLPVSSTGHMLLVDEFLKLAASEQFKELFFTVIQLGAILAVVVRLFHRMWPLRRTEEGKIAVRPKVISVWLKVVLACIPGALATFVLDDWVDAHLETPVVIALMLILYGVAFILVENWNRDRRVRVKKLSELTYKDALLIGLFQVLSIVPGTSRSGATIIGALILGIGRVPAVEFTFFMAVPVMLGMSALKILKLGLALGGGELVLLLLGVAVAFFVSLLVVDWMLRFIKRHTFKPFGWYRIALGAVVLIYFLLIR